MEMGHKATADTEDMLVEQVEQVAVLPAGTTVDPMRERRHGGEHVVVGKQWWIRRRRSGVQLVERRLGMEARATLLQLAVEILRGLCKESES